MGYFSGALDTSTIHIVPKNKLNELGGQGGTPVMKKVPMKVLNQPFETTFRLQVTCHKQMDIYNKILLQHCYNINLVMKSLTVFDPKKVFTGSGSTSLGDVMKQLLPKARTAQQPRWRGWKHIMFFSQTNIMH